MCAQVYFVLLQSTLLRDRWTDRQTQRKPVRCTAYSRTVKSEISDDSVGVFEWGGENGSAMTRTVHLSTDLPVYWLIYLSTDLYAITAATASMKQPVALRLLWKRPQWYREAHSVDLIRSAVSLTCVTTVSLTGVTTVHLWLYCRTCNFIWYSLISSDEVFIHGPLRISMPMADMEECIHVCNYLLWCLSYSSVWINICCT